jgi:predicted DNA-binding transcriptional regulator AlpA
MNTSGVEPLAVSANDLAALFSVSVRQIWSMHQAGSLGPSPLRLGVRLSRWDRKEVERWWHASKAVGRPISRNEWLRRQDA